MVHLQLRGAGDGGARGVHGVHRELPGHRRPVPPPQAPFLQQQVRHTFNFLVHDGYAKESVPKHVAIAFLERLKGDFKGRYGGGKADTATAKSLNKEFGPIIKEHMQYIVEHANEIEKLLKVKAQVSEVKNIMLENIKKAVDRGEKLTDLQDKTMDLCSQAQDSRKQGTRVLKENVVSKHEN